MVAFYPSNLSIDLDFLARFTRGERVTFAARYARIALQLLDKLDFPVTVSERAAMAEAVNLADDAAKDEVSLELLEVVLNETGCLADVSLTRCRLHSELALGHVARAVYAAVRTALTGSLEHARDAMDYTFEAVRCAGAWDLEELLGEESRRFRTDGCSVDSRQIHSGPMHAAESRPVSPAPIGASETLW